MSEMEERNEAEDGDEECETESAECEVTPEEKDVRGDVVWKVMLTNLPKFMGHKQMKELLAKSNIPAPKRVTPKKGQAFLEYRTEEEARESCQLCVRLTHKGRKLGGKVFSSAPRGERKMAAVEPLKGDIYDAMVAATTPLWDVAYEDQLTQKEAESQKLRDQLLKELFGSHPATHGSIRPCPGGAASRRNKCEFSIGLGVGGAAEVGFQVKGTSAVANPRRCSLVSPAMADLVDAFTKVVADSELPACGPDTGHKGFWRLFTVREFQSALVVIVSVKPSDDETNAKVQETLKEFAKHHGNVKSLFWTPLVNTSDAPTFQLLFGEETVEESICGLRFRVSPGAFFQTISSAAESLYTAVGEQLALSPAAVLLDICCGTGTIGLSLASRVRFVLGLELVSSAVDDAKANQAINGVTNAAFVQGRAEELFAHFPHYLPRDAKDAAVVGVLDPPRAGLHSRLIASIRRTEKMSELIYVSCDPRLAKQNFVDLCRPISNKFAGRSFTLQSVTPVDMFPNTRHFEWIMLFKR